MLPVTVKQLEIFVRVVEQGSFRSCAEYLSVTPVSVSGHIAELESRLGCELFVRKPGHNAELTPKGQLAYNQTISILRDIRELTHAFSDKPGDSSISLALHPFISRYMLGFIKRFEAEHAGLNVEVRLTASPTQELVSLVTRGDADLSFVLTCGQDDTQGMEQVADEPMAIFVAHDHPLSQAEVVSVDALSAYPVVHLSHNNHLRYLTDKTLQQVGLSDNDILLETDEYALILDTVANSDGFVCMFEYNVGDEVLSKRFAKLNLEVPLPALQVQCYSRRMSSGDLLLKKLKNDLSSLYQSMRASPHQQLTPA